MDYPDHLIPKPDYRIIKDTTPIRAHCLQRNTGDTAILNPETGKIKVEYLAFQSDHLRDLSTNLIGVFKTEDRYWKTVEGLPVITNLNLSLFTNYLELCPSHSPPQQASPTTSRPAVPRKATHLTT
jgi:hypothetical protein